MERIANTLSGLAVGMSCEWRSCEATPVRFELRPKIYAHREHRMAQLLRLCLGLLCVIVAVCDAPAIAAELPSGGDVGFAGAASAAVERIEREDGFSGVILLARGDKVLLRKAAGFADRERKIRNTPDTKFPIESVSKQFTATAIMMLVDGGKISLDNSILKYYPEGPATWRNITIRHLLTHSSGFEDRPGLFESRGDFYRAI